MLAQMFRRVTPLLQAAPGPCPRQRLPLPTLSLPTLSLPTLLLGLVLTLHCTDARAQNPQPEPPRIYAGSVVAAGRITVRAPISGSVGQVPVVPGSGLSPAAKMVFISAPELGIQTAAAKAEREVAEAELALAEARRTLIRWEIEQARATKAGSSREPAPEEPAPDQPNQPKQSDPAAEGGLLRIAAADQEVIIARARVRLAQTRVLAAEAAQERTWVRSPLPDARVLQVFAQKGQTVAAGVTPLLELAHGGHMEVHFQIPPGDWASGRFTRGAEFLVRVQPFPGEPSRAPDLKGTLLHVEPRLEDGGLPAVLKVATPKNGPELLPGRMVDLRLAPKSSGGR